MKLTVVVHDNRPYESREGGIMPYVECVISGSGDDLDDVAVGGEKVQEGFAQAEQVARLTEVSKIIKNEIEGYYTLEEEFLPKVKV